jgi:hypothetical protein
VKAEFNFTFEGARKQQGRVNSPVLSEQITLTLPRASTEGSFLTIAFLLDIRRTPRARVTVVTMGSPSGMAATASETAGKRRDGSAPSSSSLVVSTNLRW